MMWKTYIHTGSEEDYSIYKEALNQATAEIRNSKRSYEQKIAFNIKHDSKSLYAYVRSKHKVQDKVGPIEENLNEYFSSVFTREDISILPVLETKFEGREFDYLGQLIVTPTMVAMKIRDMKDNKSPGVDGIPPQITIGNCRRNHHTACNSVQFVIRGGNSSVRMEKKQTLYHYLKKVQETS